MKKALIITGIAIFFLYQGLYAQGRSYNSPYNRPNGYSGNYAHPKGNPTLSTYGDKAVQEQFKKNNMVYNKLMILMIKYVQSEVAKEKGEKVSSDKIMSTDAQDYLLAVLDKMDPSDVEILMQKALQAKDMLFTE